MKELYVATVTFNQINRFRVEDGGGHFIAFNTFAELRERISTGNITASLGLSAEQFPERFTKLGEFNSLDEMEKFCGKNYPEWMI